MLTDEMLMALQGGGQWEMGTGGSLITQSAQFGGGGGGFDYSGLFSTSTLAQAMQTGGSVYGAFTAAKVTKYNAKALAREAEAAVSLVPGVRGMAAIQARRIRERGAEVVGGQRAGFGAAGVEVSGGSPMLTMLDTIRKASEDAWLARYRGDVQAWQLGEKARQLKALSGLYKWEAGQEEMGAYIQAGSSILGGLISLGAGFA